MFANFKSELLCCCRQAILQNELPVSACVVLDGRLVSINHNIYDKHAEILAIDSALTALNLKTFHNLNVSIHCSLEPCCMCMSYISYKRISRVHFFLEDKKFGGSKRIFSGESAFFYPEIIFTPDYLQNEFLKLMQEFFVSKR